MKTTVILFLTFFLSVSIVSSQMVTPSERVQTRLNVRDLPGGNVIGSLEKGERAPLLTDTISHYYQILYDGSDTGYVHKGYATIVGHGKDSLVIGSWNIKWFGYSNTDHHDYPSMADIIEKFDVMAVQELMGDECLLRLEAIKSELNSRGYQYEYIWSDSTGYLDNPDSRLSKYIEHYAYFWDTERIELLHPQAPWEFISLPAINNPNFRIVPMIADFKVKHHEGFDFRMVTVHTVFNEDIQFVRGQEIQFLHDWMNEQIFNLDIEEKDIFLMGDFNANPDGQTAYFDSIFTDTTAYRIMFKEPLMAGEKSKRTTILKKQNASARDSILPAYDHLLLSKHTSYAIPIYPVTWASGIIGVVEFDQDQKWSGLSRDSLIKAMSDHRPIWIKIPFDTEDRD